MGLSSRNATLSIIVTAYHRYERFFLMMACLLGAVRKAAVNTEIIIIDNSRDSRLRHALRRFLSFQSTLVTILYHHDPDLIQSTARNLGLKLSYGNSSYIMILDSDIYLAERTLRLCLDFLASHPSVSGVAAPLLGYFGGSHRIARQTVGDIGRDGDQSRLLMPCAYYLKHGHWHDKSFLETLMLRGMYILRREVFSALGTNCEPWLVDFVLWQNVPFFMSLRETGKIFGYLVKSEVLCLHDERESSYTIRHSLAAFKAETVKAIVLLIYRNRLWERSRRGVNERFLSRMKFVVEQMHPAESQRVLGVCFEIARILQQCGFQNGKRELRNLLAKSRSELLEQVIERLTYSAHCWRRMKCISSLNPAVPM